MTSLVQSLTGLLGLVCSALLAVGLVADDSSRALTSPIEKQPATAIAPLLQAVEHVSAANIARAMPIVAELAAPADVNAELASRQASMYRVCRVTAYCDRGTTASGVHSGLGQCAAPADIPFGSQIYVPALDRTFVVTDRTHRRFRRSTVDIFMPTRSQCREFGCDYLECEIALPKDLNKR